MALDPLLPMGSSSAAESTVDELLTLATFGVYQRRQLSLCCACFGMSAGALLLPNLLLPRLWEAWELTEEETAYLDSLFFAGNTIGLLAWGVVGDLFGRRPCACTALLLLMIGGGGTFACESLESLMAMRTFTGFAVGGVMNATFLLVLEVCPPDARMTGKQALAIYGWVTGVFWVTGVAYLTQDATWRLLALYMLPAPLLLAMMLLWLRESPRFLLTSGRADEAMAALVALGRLNRSPLPPDASVKPIAAQSAGDYSGESSGGSSGESSGGSGSSGGSACVTLWAKAAALFAPSLRRPTVLVGLAWLSSTSSYYGVVLAPPPFGDVDVYVQNALGGLLELPAYMLLPTLGNRLGRSRAWALFLLLCAGPLLIMALLRAEDAPDDAALMVLALLARFGATGASTICYVAAAEQWPTMSRNLGLGYGAALGRLGSILAPLTRLTPSPFAIIGLVGAIGALAATGLPETKGRAIAETVQEGAVTATERQEASTSTAEQPEASSSATKSRTMADIELVGRQAE